MRPAELTLTIDGCSLIGDGGRGVGALSGVLRGPRGKEQRVVVHVAPEGWQVTGVTRVPLWPRPARGAGT